MERNDILIALKFKILKGGRCLVNIFRKLDPLKKISDWPWAFKIWKISCDKTI